MATYTELFGLFNTDPLIYKIQVAIVEAARIISSGEDTGAPFDQTTGAHDNRIRWAAAAIVNTETQARNIFKLVLVQNKSATVANIQNATDAAIQTNVNALIDALAKALSL